jgi:hypothetical protein
MNFGNCAKVSVASQQLNWFFHPNGAVNFFALLVITFLIDNNCVRGGGIFEELSAGWRRAGFVTTLRRLSL